MMGWQWHQLDYNVTLPNTGGICSTPQSLVAPTARMPCSNAANTTAQDWEDAK